MLSFLNLFLSESEIGGYLHLLLRHGQRFRLLAKNIQNKTQPKKRDPHEEVGSDVREPQKAQNIISHLFLLCLLWLGSVFEYRR